MADLQKESVLRFDKVAYLLICILMADCCFSGSGTLVSVGMISIRLVIFAITMLCSVFIMFSRIQKLLRSPIGWSVVLFAIWILLETVLGVANGNEASSILTDLKGFCYFVFFPVAICVINSRERIIKLMNIMVYASGALGLASVFHLVVYLTKPDLFNYLYSWGLSVNFSGFNSISETIPRLFFYGSGYLICGCAFATYLHMTSSKFCIQYVVIAGVNLFAILMTYTRSLFVSAAIAAAVLVVGSLVYQDKNGKVRMWKSLGAAVVVFCVVLFSFSLGTDTDYLGYAFDRAQYSFESMDTESVMTEPTDLLLTEHPPTEPIVTEPIFGAQDLIDSDQIRSMTLKELGDRVKESPIIGHGLGFGLEVRNGEAHEFFWLDLIMKCGLVGFVAYMLPIIVMVIWMIRGFRERKEQWLIVVPWMATLMGFVVYSIFTPEMNCSNGILFYGCVAGVCHAIYDEQLKKTS